jgi:hypothetical protein
VPICRHFLDSIGILRVDRRREPPCVGLPTLSMEAWESRFELVLLDRDSLSLVQDSERKMR